jgi:hypothetical protein
MREGSNKGSNTDQADNDPKFTIHIPTFTTSRRIRAADFQSQWLKDRAGEMGEKVKLHRKVWELCVEAQVYRDNAPVAYDCSRVLGFGVGREPLPSWFAARGCNVVATDAPLTDDIKHDWSKTGQHAYEVDDLYRKEIVSLSAFDKYVLYQSVDMNNIPDYLLQGKFDYTYSTSSFEHIGGIDRSLVFFCNQMRCLKPGGIACHTTEYNVTSNTNTLDSHNLCFFRRKDLERLSDMLTAQGDTLWPLDLEQGDSELDRIVDVLPYEGKVHLQIKTGPWVSTSVVLIAQRGGRVVWGAI